MDKYLQYLLEDIESSRSLAGAVLQENRQANLTEPNGYYFGATKRLPLEQLLGIPANAFPPVHLLKPIAISKLLNSLLQLLHSWQLRWQMPPNLTEHQLYMALVHTMSVESLEWTPQTGGEINICKYEERSFCPYGENANYCHCREMAAAAKHEYALWEEHVRSQGIDPYRELTPEEGAAFLEGIRKRQQRK